jgi:NhaP-type Na+/H+ or K+/H+ antiporter
MTARAVCPHVEEFTDDMAQLLAMISFVVFGAIIIGPSLGEIDWRIAAYVVASLVLVRPIAIGLSLVGSGLRFPTVAFFGWFGPRGLASIIFGLGAVAEIGEADAGPIFVVVSWTVLVSIVAHGLSATPAAAAYGRWWNAMDDPTLPEAQPMKEQRVKLRPPGWKPTDTR